MTYVIAEPCIFPEDALPEKWEPFVRVNAAWNDGGAEAVNVALAAHLNGDGNG